VLEISYLGHSAFRLRGKEVTILTDPFSPDLGFSMGTIAADIVTVSHASPNHSFVDGVAGNYRVVRGPGEYEIAEVLIAGVPTDVAPGTGIRNTAYVMRVDDVTVCHLGDLADKLTDEQLEQIGDVGVLLIPVGGGTALGPTAAAEVVAQLEPSLVIPMHFSNTEATGLGTVDYFLREMGRKEWAPEPKVTVSRGSLGSEMKIVVLDRKSA
jgi:L-ascorbate metabolism protein UlaG (beta-lactamase superfamily)